MSQFVVGDTIRVYGEFRPEDTNVLTDPTTLQNIVNPPDGDNETFIYLTDSEVVRVTVGIFYLQYVVALAGEYAFRWEATGAAVGVEEVVIRVKASRVI